MADNDDEFMPDQKTMEGIQGLVNADGRPRACAVVEQNGGLFSTAPDVKAAFVLVSPSGSNAEINAIVGGVGSPDAVTKNEADALMARESARPPKSGTTVSCVLRR